MTATGDQSSGTTPDVASLDDLRPVENVQIYLQVSQRLVEAIRSGRWLPGQRLPSERDLARSLNVSRPSLREALAALQLMGVVTTRQGAPSRLSESALEIVGAQQGRQIDFGVVDVSPVALLDVREILEPAIASMAAARFEADPELDALLTVMTDNNDPDRGDRAAWNNADRLFHRRIAIHTGNPVLLQFADYVAGVMNQPLWRRVRDDMLAVPGRLETSAAEHRRILDALHRRHSAASAAHAQEHIREIRTHMRLDAN